MQNTNPSNKTCLECGLESQQSDKCTNQGCEINFTVTKMMTSSCYYCGTTMTVIWASNKEFTQFDLSYMLCKPCGENK